ncbi:MAG: hypothetical protein WDZ59_13860 [Pirellulales bacterium]
MTTTMKRLAVSVTFLCGLAAALAWAGSLPPAAQAWLSAAAVGQAGADQERKLDKNQVEQLLAQARDAMKRGDWELAGSLIRRTEQSDVRFNLFHFGDTPAKARRDFDAARARHGEPSLPSEGARPSVPSDAGAADAVDPFLQRSEQLGQRYSQTHVDPALAPAADPDAIEHLAAPRRLSANPTRLATYDDAPEVTPEHVAADPLPRILSTSPAGRHAASSEQRAAADKALLSARRALAVGDLRRARGHLEEAKQIKMPYAPMQDSPAKVEAAIHDYEGLKAQPQEIQNTPAWNRDYAALLCRQSEALLAWNDLSEAERLATDALSLVQGNPTPQADPNALLARIHKVREEGVPPAPAGSRQATAAPPAANVPGNATDGRGMEQLKQQSLELLRQARGALIEGDVDRAERLAQQAQGLGVPDTLFVRGEDRPALVLLDVARSRTEGSSVQHASGQPLVAGGAQQGLFLPQQDNSQNVLAGAQDNTGGRSMLSALAQQTGPGQAEPLPAMPPVELLQQGEQALRERDLDRALQLFREAQQREDQLDPAARERLHGHLQMLTTSTSPEDIQPPLIDQAGTDQQILARKLSAEITRQQTEARKLRERNPAGALELLKQAKQSVENSGVEPNARQQLLRRVDLSITELEKYINDNRAHLELDESNKRVLEEIDRQRQARSDVQTKIAELVDQFNQLRDENRFKEMEVVAKRARELAPDEPIVQQLWQEAKFIVRNYDNLRLADAKEQSFDATMRDVEWSSVMPNDIPIDYGDPKDWQELTERRRRSNERNARSRLSERELEIKRKLRTPVMVEYSERPLAEVVDQLSRLTGINIHLDPRGLTEEGVSTDAPVTLHLNSEIALESVLRLILEPLHLSYVIQDEVLKITSEQLRKGEVYADTYIVADLVIPIPNFTPNSNMGLQGALNDAYAAIGYGGAGLAGRPPEAVIAGANGGAGSGVINPQVLAQLPGGLGQPQGPAGLMSPLRGQPQPIGAGPGGLGGGSAADFDSLIELITTTVAVDSWQENGGLGTIKEFETNLSLVISQTEEVHEQIADLLEQLRRLQDLQVTIEVRFIRVSDQFFERIGIDFDFNIEDDVPFPPQNEGDHPSATVGVRPPASPGGLPAFTADLDVPFRQESFSLATPTFGSPVDVASFGFAILSDIEAYFLINAAQGDRRTNILQAPKVTLFNGQQALVSDTSQRPFVVSVVPVVGDFAAAQQPVIVVLSEGTFMTIQAVVSNDRRYVRLTVIPFFSQIGEIEEFTFEGTSSSTNSSSSGVDEDDDSVRNEEEEETIERTGTTVQQPTFSLVSVTTTVSVPDGGTVLLGGIKRLSEGRNEFGVPLLSKVPYVSRLFRNVGIGRQTESLMMMVTPRIIIQEEEEPPGTPLP